MPGGVHSTNVNKDIAVAILLLSNIISSMDHQINLGIQVVPVASASDGYPIIDACIEIIQKSGIPYTVTPFETVLEGRYTDIMELVDQLYDQSLARCEEVVINIRIHAKRSEDVRGSDKTNKFNR